MGGGWGGRESGPYFLCYKVGRYAIIFLYLGWVCCWFLSLLPGFFARFSGFPPSTKTNNSKFQFDLETVDEELHALHRYATANSHLFPFQWWPLEITILQWQYISTAVMTPFVKRCMLLFFIIRL